MKEYKNTFVVKLIDSYSEEPMLCVVDTNGSLEEFKKIYNDARNEWYENCEGLDCLFGHISSRLAEHDIMICEQEPTIDLELDF